MEKDVKQFYKLWKTYHGRCKKCYCENQKKYKHKQKVYIKRPTGFMKLSEEKRIKVLSMKANNQSLAQIAKDCDIYYKTILYWNKKNQII
jgi:hypothetical protein